MYDRYQDEKKDTEAEPDITSWSFPTPEVSRIPSPRTHLPHHPSVALSAATIAAICTGASIPRIGGQMEEAPRPDSYNATRRSSTLLFPLHHQFVLISIHRLSKRSFRRSLLPNRRIRCGRRLQKL